MEIPQQGGEQSGFSDRRALDEVAADSSAVVIDEMARRICDHQAFIEVDGSNRDEVAKVYADLALAEKETDKARPDIRAAKDLAAVTFESAFSRYATPPYDIDSVTFSVFELDKNPLTKKGFPKNAAGGFGSNHGLTLLNMPYTDSLVARSAGVTHIEKDTTFRYFVSRMILHEFLHSITAKTEHTDRGLVEKSGFQAVTFLGDGKVRTRNIGLNECATDYLSNQAILDQDPNLRNAFSREGEQPRYKVIAALIKLVGEKTFIQAYLANDANRLREAVDKGKGNQGRFNKVVELVDDGYMSMEQNPQSSVAELLEATALLKK
jgi:hypothetical protein